MNDEERAQKIVDNMDVGCDACFEYHFICLDCCKTIAQALREYGDERLEEAAKMAEAQRTAVETLPSSWQRKGWAKCATVTAGYIRALKDEDSYIGKKVILDGVERVITEYDGTKSSV